MFCIKTYDDLRRETLWHRRQFWYYVIILNPRDISSAGKVILENLDYFHIDSGEDCIYFIPGFLNTHQGIVREILNYFKHTDIIKIRNYGNVQFFLQDFVECIHQLEIHNKNHWRYSGECELLLFNIDDNGRIMINDFASYNLDDIIRNDRTISSFIRETINIGKDAAGKMAAKRKLDEVYASLILPPVQANHPIRSSFVWTRMQDEGFQKEKYYFISYSSKDYWFVSQIRDAIEKAGIRCWMAPRDIPHGTNYAHIIEVAIQNAQRFIILLSNSSIWSVWVEKELQRAIHHFQHESSSKIVAVWLENQFELDNTPMAYPIEGVQIIGQLKSVEDYRLLLPSELQDRLKTKDKVEATLNSFKRNMVTSRNIQEDFSKLLGIAMSIQKHIMLNENNPHQIKLKELCDQLKSQLQRMKAMSELDDDYCSILASSFKHQIKATIRKIADTLR